VPVYLVMAMIRSTVVPPSQSAQSPLLKYIPRPKCQGMRRTQRADLAVHLAPHPLGSDGEVKVFEPGVSGIRQDSVGAKLVRRAGCGRPRVSESGVSR